MTEKNTLPNFVLPFCMLSQLDGGAGGPTKSIGGTSSSSSYSSRRACGGSSVSRRASSPHGSDVELAAPARLVLGVVAGDLGAHRRVLAPLVDLTVRRRTARRDQREQCDDHSDDR